MGSAAVGSSFVVPVMRGRSSRYSETSTVPNGPSLVPREDHRGWWSLKSRPVASEAFVRAGLPDADTSLARVADIRHGADVADRHRGKFHRAAVGRGGVDGRRRVLRSQIHAPEIGRARLAVVVHRAGHGNA